MNEWFDLALIVFLVSIVLTTSLTALFYLSAKPRVFRAAIYRAILLGGTVGILVSAVGGIVIMVAR